MSQQIVVEVSSAPSQVIKKPTPQFLKRCPWSCKGICHHFKFKPLTPHDWYVRRLAGIKKTTKGNDVYSRGLKYCVRCDAKFQTDRIRCQCCNVKLRVKSRHYGKNKKVKRIG